MSQKSRRHVHFDLFFNYKNRYLLVFSDSPHVVFFIFQESHDSEFLWTAEETSPIIQQFNDFLARFSPEINLSTDSSELDFFEYFVDDGLVAEIVRCTNRYYQFYVRRVDIREHSRTHGWRDVNAKDIYLFFVTMLFTRNKRISIEEHWSTDPLLSSPIFQKTMNRNKYCLIFIDHK